MKKQNIKIRIIALLIALVLCIIGICFRTTHTLVFIGGVAVGALCLMILRTWLWNTHELIKGK